jgi:hypothetical protein
MSILPQETPATITSIPDFFHKSESVSTNPPTKKLTKSSQAAVRYLLDGLRDDEEARAEAFEHLLAILLCATKGLYIPESDRSPSDDSAKYRFAVDFLLAELEPYREADQHTILAAAYADKFRHLGNKFRCRVLNKIRDTIRAAKRNSFVLYNDAWAAHQGRRSIPPLQAEEFDELLQSCTFLSDAAVQTVATLFGSRDLCKGNRTRALAESRGVSVQQARADIRRAREEFSEALKNGDKSAKEMADRLASHIVPTELKPRDLKFWDEKNPGTSIQTAQFDSSAFRKRREQDSQYSVREYSPEGLRLNSRSYKCVSVPTVAQEEMQLIREQCIDGIDDMSLLRKLLRDDHDSDLEEEDGS